MSSRCDWCYDDHDILDCPNICLCGRDRCTPSTHECPICLDGDVPASYMHDLGKCPYLCPCEDDQCLSSFSHVCLFCDHIGFNHYSDDCLDKCDCTIRCSDVYGGMEHSKKHHRCFICGDKRFHFIDECHLYCPCGVYHSRNEHVCKFCKEKGYRHSHDSCPEKCPCFGSNIYITNTKHGQSIIPHSVNDHYCQFCKKSGFSHLPNLCAHKCACESNIPHRLIEHNDTIHGLLYF